LERLNTLTPDNLTEEINIWQSYRETTISWLTSPSFMLSVWLLDRCKKWYFRENDTIKWISHFIERKRKRIEIFLCLTP